MNAEAQGEWVGLDLDLAQTRGDAPGGLCTVEHLIA
jgi:hypothetical protein